MFKISIMRRQYFKLVWVLLVALSLNDVFAQQDAQYTQYMYNMNILNPAYAGSKTRTLSVSLLGRTQWVGVPGAPNSAVLSVHSPITDQMGLGVSILTDKIGPVNEQFVHVDYSYSIPVGYYDDYLAFGLKAGFSFLNAKLTDLKLLEINDANFDSNVGNLKPNVGFGMFYYGEQYYAGISVPNLLQTTYLEKSGGIATQISKRNHLFLTGGYVMDFAYDWKFKPSILVKAALGAPVSIDTSFNFLFDDTFEVGTSYRWGDSASMMFNAKVSKSLRIGYSYDFTTSELRKFNSGSHELIILYDLNTSYEVISPRFF